MRTFLIGAAAAAAICGAASAHEAPEGATIAKDHAPIGVMGDHMHKKGEFMFSYRFMRMNMDGSLIGSDEASPDLIATTIPNRFFGVPNQPPTLRVVPLNMQMNMHMAGVMYAPTDWLTLMAMGQVATRTMDHQTYMGPAGTNVLGGFTTHAAGFGDTSLTALVRAFEVQSGGVKHHAHFNLGVSLPTGSITKADDVLTPMGTTPTLRLPYPMQLGSGTFDLMPGFTYTGKTDSFSWGAQYRATLRLGANDQGYAYGDKQLATGWAQWGPAPWISFSGRAAFTHQGRIDGIDPMIVAPVQTANPDFQGGDRLDLGFGVNLAGQSGAIAGHRLAVEVLFPVYQRLNGPQLGTDWTLTVGWQKAF